MENKNKQIEEVINTSELSAEELLEIESLLPTNMLIKISLAKDLKFLSNDDKAAIFTNMFNYHTGTELVEMTGIAQMFFSRLEEVFEYNINQYQEVVKKNRKNGRKGGRPIKKTQNNPTVSSVNPNNLKDKGILNVKEIDKPNIKLIEKEIVIENSSIKKYQSKIRKIIEIDFRSISDKESKFFCYDVIELVEKLGWTRFDLIMFGTPAKDISSILSAYNLIELETQVKSTRRNFCYFIDKLIE
jgi:hypothetical protein